MWEVGDRRYASGNLYSVLKPFNRDLVRHRDAFGIYLRDIKAGKATCLRDSMRSGAYDPLSLYSSNLDFSLLEFMKDLVLRDLLLERHHTVRRLIVRATKQALQSVSIPMGLF